MQGFSFPPGYLLHLTVKVTGQSEGEKTCLGLALATVRTPEKCEGTASATTWQQGCRCTYGAGGEKTGDPSPVPAPEEAATEVLPPSVLPGAALWICLSQVLLGWNTKEQGNNPAD